MQWRYFALVNSMRRSTLLPIVAAASLGAFVYFFEVRRGEQPGEKAYMSLPAFIFKPAEIAEINLTRQGQTIRIENREGKWVITEPVSTPADQTAVGSIAEAIATAGVDRRIPFSPGETKAYGLDQPAVILEIKLRGGELHRLRLGSANFSGSWVYAEVDGSADVALLPVSLLTNSDKSLQDLRDRSLLDVSQDEVKSLELTNENGRFSLTHDGSDWTLSRPVEAAADSVVAESLVGEAASTQVVEFASESAVDLAKYGLDKPEITLTMRLQSGGESALIIEAKEKDFNYAKRSDRPQILKIGSSLYDKLNVKLANLYDRNIIRFNPDDLTRVRIKNRHQMLAAEKGQDEQWVVKERTGIRGEDLDITRILNVLRTTRADEVMDRPSASVMSRLARPEAEVQLTNGDGKTQTLWVSAADGDNAYAKRKASLLVYKISRYLVQDLNFK